MTNRKRIEKFCKERNLTIVSLDWERNTDMSYGDSWDSSCWNLVVMLGGEEHLYAPEDDTTEKAIQKMFEEIDDDLADLAS